MVLAGFGLSISEEKLRQMCDCTIFGTEALQAVEAARQLGFVETSKTNLTLLQLHSLVETSINPIVYVELMPIDQIWGIHALVVEKINSNFVTVLDPLKGERSINKAVFEAAYRLTKGLTIIVSSL